MIKLANYNYFHKKAANKRENTGSNMVYCSSTNMSSQNESEVESLLMSPCWNTGNNGQDYMLDGHKLLLEHDLESLPSDSETQKNSMELLDNLLSNSSTPISRVTNLAELKPLPPFTGYTGHLSINGISGHHYHAIAQRIPEENNNYTQSSYQSQCDSTNAHHNIVSSSTCLPDSVLNPDGSADSCLTDVKLFSDNSIDGKIYSITTADSCVTSESNGHNGRIKMEELSEYDMSSIEDIAAIIGSAIADTTVPNNRSENGDQQNGDTRDSWMDLDAWIEDTCVPQDSKMIVTQHDSLNDFILPHSPMQTSGSTLQSLLTHGYMPLLQNRLQNGPPIKVEAPTSTSYCNELISTSTSPPGSVCSTTDNLMLNGNRYLTNNHQQSHHYQISMNNSGMKNDGLCSPELYPHTTTISSNSTSSKAKRCRSQKKAMSHMSVSSGQQQTQSQSQNNSVPVSAHNFQTSNDLSGLLGKEKPVHRCNICNRGFLNKSNIKVHLRTHTGEKPFRQVSHLKSFKCCNCNLLQ